MATVKRMRMTTNEVDVHRDQREHVYDEAETEEAEQMDESRGPLEESGCTHDGESEEEVEECVAEDMERFEQSFRNITQRYKLINRIGEGTFSTVYKAEDLLYDRYQNDWNQDEKALPHSKHAAEPQRKPKPRYVAIKKIYVTSSPMRIFNELELLYDLRDSPNVCPLITAFRHQDQVIAVLPYFQHRDFREYFRDMPIPEMRYYFTSLFTAVAAVHEKRIIHRDIKPTNFLYSPGSRRGVLVDFGLAEREGTDWYACNCSYDPEDRRRRIQHSAYAKTKAHHRAMDRDAPIMYPKEDQRHSRRANRAGTRGFRAPEVLLKCTAQTCSIDVWSCGVILLTLLSRRFPFFHSADDIDAFIELCTIFGKRRMQECASLHGQVLQTTIPTISEGGHSWEKILLWCTNRNKKEQGGGLTAEETEAVEFMRCCLELDPAKRITANDALRHPFLQIREGDDEEDGMDRGSQEK